MYISTNGYTSRHLHITTTTKGRPRPWRVYSCPNWTQFSTGIIVQFYSIRGHVNALMLRQLYKGWLTGGPSSRDKMAQEPSTDNGGHRNSFSCPIQVLHSPFYYWRRRSSLLSRFRSGNVGAQELLSFPLEMGSHSG